MRINEYLISVFSLGLVAGSILTLAHAMLTRDRRVIPELRRLISEIQNRVEFLGYYNDLTAVQKRMTMDMSRFVSLEEMLVFYRWASDIEGDPVALTAQAIICEKLLGLTRMDALRAQRQGKRADDLKTLLPSKNHPETKISN